MVSSRTREESVLIRVILNGSLALVASSLLGSKLRKQPWRDLLVRKYQRGCHGQESAPVPVRAVAATFCGAVRNRGEMRGRIRSSALN